MIADNAAIKHTLRDPPLVSRSRDIGASHHLEDAPNTQDTAKRLAAARVVAANLALAHVHAGSHREIEAFGFRDESFSTARVVQA